MYHLILYLILSGITFTKSEDELKTVCFEEKIGNSICKCEFFSLDQIIIPDLDAESKLTCVGEDSLEMAVEALTFRKHLLFTELVITNGTFDIIDHSDLQHFPNLKNLTLSDNHISFLTIGTFKYQNSLEHLDLSINNLTSLPNSVFEALTHLSNVTFSHNQISSIESKVFSNLCALLYLDLSNNQLPSVDCNWFSGLKILKVLLLNNNKISYINNTFHLPYLQHLDLSFNNLKHIANLAFFRLKNLKFLSLAMNELTTLNENAVKGISNLEKVNLTGMSKE